MPLILLPLFFVNGKANEEKLFRLGPNLVGSRLLFGGTEPFKSLLMLVM